MQLAWLPWLVPALLLANGIFSFALGYRSKRSLYVMSSQAETAPINPAATAATAKAERERVLVRPDLGLYAENETLRDALAKAEAVISETERSLRETKAALARSEARILDADRVKLPLTRSVFAPRARQVEPR
jgi:hypothetical protein